MYRTTPACSAARHAGALLLILALVAVGCGSTTDPQDEGAVPAADLDTATTRPPASTTTVDRVTTTAANPSTTSVDTPTTAAPATIAPTTSVTTPEISLRTVKLYFTHDAASDNLADPYVTPVSREIDASLPVGRGTIEALLQGPTEAELAAGFTTNIPTDTLLLDLNIADGLATIDLSGNYEAGGGTASMTARLAEVVLTLTQFPTVDRVEFRLDGEPVTVFSSEGLVLDAPVTRDSYAGLRPAIFVDSPAWGSSRSVPVRIVGQAAVFEATFVAQFLAADRSPLTEPTVVMTSDGTGWGTFDATLDLPAGISDTDSVILRVLAYSAMDGSEINVVEIVLGPVA